MTPGSYIAIGAFSLYGGLILYGFSSDVRRWVEERLWRRDQKCAVRQLSAYGGKLDYEPYEFDRFRAAQLEAWATQADEIAALPEIEPDRRLAL